MGIYLIKSTAILAIFWMLYVLFLEKENMHRFKRFYLLTSIVAAFCIPLLSITQYVYVESINGLNFSNAAIPFSINESLKVVETPFLTLEHILWSVYILGVAIFSLRFIKNLFSIVKTINTNEKQKQSSITFVLLKSLINPHTFFNFIFLNKLKFQKNEVPKEVLLHEEVHAKQKHSLDILFIELMQIVFWFQPFIWLYKKRIKLNHEFLADQAVIDKGFEPANYQNTLLSYSSHQDYSLANAIDYSSIKKRFTVMKTQTSQKRKWLLGLLILPVLGVLFYGFSERTIVEVPLQNEISEKNASVLEKEHTARSISIKVLGNNNYEVDGMKTKKASLASTVNKLHQDISTEVRNKIINIHLMFEGEESNEEVWFIYNALKDYGFHRLVTKNQEVIKSKGNTPFLDNKKSEKQQKLPTAKEIAAYNAWAKKINAKSTTFATGEKLLPPVDEQNLIKYAGIYNSMSAEQKQKAEEMPFPGFEYVKGTETSITNPVSILVNGKNCDPCELTKDDLVNMKLTSNTGSEVTSFAIKFKGYPTQVNQGNTLNKKTKAIVSQYTENSPAQILNIKLNGSKETFSKLILFKQQNPPTAKEVTAYNAWAKKINTKNKAAESTGEYAIVKHKEVLKYKAIYDRMTKAQKSKAEAWPNFPPPPPPPPAPKALKNQKSESNIPPPPPPIEAKSYKKGDRKSLQQIINETPKDVKSGYEVLDNGESHFYRIYKGYKIYYNKDGYITDDKGNVLPPPPPPPAPKKADKSKGGPNADEIVSDYNDCLVIPKSFITKNRNTLNINCIENHSENKFQVFNRWGNLIYSKENYNNNWDGTVEKSFAQDGSDKPISGTYYYVFSSPNLKKEKAGFLIINAENINTKN
ncbi:beta-lactamase regulating signal transducer with metallopeptidase domain [Winogradskyella wandonensis]|uniref:Beta-lactamase regulating signal transducer with metallopeptidase domain n=1 Tax=Winogradskyella wandonensis TaxID=1442586 RepID=A0A4R1KKA5_9FLAO|nr:gliding motility-associated C-terminal domain-containing protein [Winogradskyella wandonensis]TCK65184.1 beta-lactamase regulating signal transducer with metallopeptidase domain [Winogradskyella wandonensis]